MLTSSKRLIRLTALSIAANVCLSGALAQAVPLVWGNNSGNRIWDTTSANWGDGVTLYNNATPDSVTFGNVGAGLVTVAAGLTPASVEFSSGNYTVRAVGGVSGNGGTGWGGNGSLTKSGTGNLTIQTKLNHTGGTFVNAGKLNVYLADWGGSVGPVGSQNITVESGAILEGERTNFSGTLTLNGGTWKENNGFGGSWTGPVILGADSTVDSFRNLSINGPISGPGGIIKKNNGHATVGANLTLNGVHTYTGDTFINGLGTITLPDNAGLLFEIGAAGVNNQILGTGPGIVNLRGDFTFDLTGASRGEGDTWNIVDIASLNANFFSTFTVNGFADIGNDQWQTVFGGTTFIFSEATGLLVAVPEPSSFALLGLASVGLAGLGLYRRRRN